MLSRVLHKDKLSSPSYTYVSSCISEHTRQAYRRPPSILYLVKKKVPPELLVGCGSGDVQLKKEQDMTQNREQAHLLIDRLPEMHITALVGLMEAIVDPAAAALRNAPPDDEPETEEEKIEAAEAHAWLQQNGGKGIPHEEAMRRLGL